MKIYLVNHIPTGLYYQPHKHRGSNLSKKGKIYQTGTHGLSSAIKTMNNNPEGNNGKNKLFAVYVEKDSPVYKLSCDILQYSECSWSFNQMKAYTNISDWITEEINN